MASDGVVYGMISPPYVKTITTYPYIREGMILTLFGALILIIAYVTLLQILGAAKEKSAESPQLK